LEKKEYDQSVEVKEIAQKNDTEVAKLHEEKQAYMKEIEDRH